MDFSRLAISIANSSGAPSPPRRPSAAGTSPSTLYALGLTVLAAGLAAAPARAADAPSAFERDRNVAVRDRPRPEYDTAGLPVGSFRLFPSLQLDVERNGNIYATETNEVSDTVAAVAPQVTLRSQWSVHELDLHARGNFARYFDRTTENRDNYWVGADGRVDIRRGSYIPLGAEFSRQTELRTSPNNVFGNAEPINYNVTNLYGGGVFEANRIKLSGRANYYYYDYDNGRTPSGAVVFQNDRDHSELTLTGRVDYAVKPNMAVFTSVAWNQRDYRLNRPTVPFDRNSTGYEGTVGIDLDLTSVIRGQFQIGYLDQNYEDLRLKNLKGVQFGGKLEWFPTQLTTVTLTGQRLILETGVPGAASYLSSILSLRADHELLRNLILSASLRYARDRFNGVDRRDRRWGGDLGAVYFVSRRVGLHLTLSHDEQNSVGFTRAQNYNVNRAIAGVTLQL